ncbi:site-specific DNA-methyltransferase [Sulfitobacter albidus]|uniref:site-specific DNA-methyltransferase (adenine-specific) n=1 Tax=Sulfitobacter albidus TaxID=2829501 RepID=A0A975JEQ6_9RHOB|nr:site-specific DNA-methyltransferase [Sulfitobacter albidus]QUJ76962.1 site-specific DNA-methyltransferase [Sulfitobacter albidus]
MTDEIDKLKMHSPDLTQDNIAKIRALFPGCVTEAAGEDGAPTLKVDFDQLRQELSDAIVEGPQERYHLDWPGKRQALITANAPIAKTLRPVREESVDFDTTQNLFIEGDNLEALKLLQETYLSKVKMIYIDPPYNTGKDFIYKDNFAKAKEDYEIEAGVRDLDGGQLVSNPESRGRYHSDWMSMMYSRLTVAKRLLMDEGIILVSIDDYEQSALRKLMDEVFGERNFIAQLTWEKGRKNDAKFFSVGHEYMLVFGKNVSKLRERHESWREEKPGAREIWDEFIRLKQIHGDDFKEIERELSQWYSDLPKGHPAKKWARYKRVDKNGPWRDRDISWPGGDGPTYDVIHPITKQPCAVPEAGWRYASPDEMQRQIKLGLVEFRDDHTEPPFRKAHIRPAPGEADDEQSDQVADEGGDTEEDGADAEFATQVRGSYFYKQSQVSVKYLRNLMGGKVFTNPKDHEELAKLIEYVSPKDRDGIIIDFFAGSASTAEATMRANAIYGSNHQFIMVQLPESLVDAEKNTTGTAKKTVQAAIKLMKKNNRPPVLSEVSKERIRRAGAKILEGDTHPDWNKDVGFRVLKIDSSNIADVYYTPDATTQADLLTRVDNIKPDRSPEDLLFQVLLDWGVDLTLPITREVLHGKTVFFVAGTALAACFDDGVDEVLVKDLATRAPLRVVFKDTGFKDDATKINVKQIFKSLSPDTDVKAI